MTRCTWTGPPGVNPVAGTVEPGKALELSQEDFEFLESRGVVVEAEQIEKPAEKKGGKK
jgi:hypothetical protein